MEKIRRLTLGDILIIQELVRKVWPFTYKDILSQQQIDYMLEMMYSTSALTKQMQDDHRFFGLYSHETPVGFVSISTNNTQTILHKIYLDQSFQGKGFGKKLIDFVERKAIEERTNLIILNVNRYNPAVNFYKKCGFIIAEEVDNPIGNGYYMNDYVMHKAL